MQTLTFDKRSWHYAIAKFGGFNSWSDQDLCTYTGKFTRGLFGAFLLGLVIALLGFGLSHLVLGIIFSIIAGAWVTSEVGTVFGLILLLLSLFVAVGVSVEKYKESREFHPRKPDGFVKNAYRGWKEKFCIKIKVVDSAQIDPDTTYEF